MPHKRKQLKSRRRRAKPSRSGRYRTLRVLTERGDQQVVFKDIIPFSNFKENEGKSGIYFSGYSLLTPFSSIKQSAYSPYVDIYDLCRIKKVLISVWIPGATVNLGGCTVAKLFRDARLNNPNLLYEGLIQERDVKRGRMVTRFNFTWFPIEPSDMEFLPINNSLDNGRFGQLNMAAISIPTPWSNAYAPIIEYTYFVDFKYLVNPPVPAIFSVPLDSDNRSEDEPMEVDEMGFEALTLQE